MAKKPWKKKKRCGACTWINILELIKWTRNAQYLQKSKTIVFLNPPITKMETQQVITL